MDYTNNSMLLVISNLSGADQKIPYLGDILDMLQRTIG